MSKLVKLAVASWRRQKLRTAMTVGSLALSVGAVVFVYSLSVAFESSGSQAIESAIGKADIWVVPAKGVEVNRKDESIDAIGSLPSVSWAPAPSFFCSRPRRNPMTQRSQRTVAGQLI